MILVVVMLARTMITRISLRDCSFTFDRSLHIYTQVSSTDAELIIINIKLIESRSYINFKYI